MKKINGNILLSIIFVFCSFSLTIALISFTLQHLQITRARKSKMDHTGKINANLSLYLHKIKEKIINENFNNFLNPENDYFVTSNFPDETINDVKIINAFLPSAQNHYTFYKEINLFAGIKASLSNFNYCQTAEIQIQILKGEIPILLFPFLKSKNILVTPIEYLKLNKIKIQSLFFPETELINNLDDFLKDTMGIANDLFNWQGIRKELNLEISENPIEDGIYILENEELINCIFIQGDVNSIIFSTLLSQEQIIQVKTPSDFIKLTYQPKTNNITLSSDDFKFKNSLDKNFSEVFIINGNVFSIYQEGDFAFQENSDIILYISKTAVIHSSLLSSPSSERSNFTLINIQSHSLDNTATDNQILIEGKLTKEIDGSLITSGKLINNTDKLQINGNLIIGTLENNGEIIINNSSPNFKLNQYFRTVKQNFFKSIFIDQTGELYSE